MQGITLGPDEVTLTSSSENPIGYHGTSYALDGELSKTHFFATTEESNPWLSIALGADPVEVIYVHVFLPFADLAGLGSSVNTAVRVYLDDTAPTGAPFGGRLVTGYSGKGINYRAYTLKKVGSHVTLVNEAANSVLAVDEVHVQSDGYCKECACAEGLR